MSEIDALLRKFSEASAEAAALYDELGPDEVRVQAALWRKHLAAEAVREALKTQKAKEAA